MYSVVKNITTENIYLCDLSNILLPPNKVVNLLSSVSQKEIDNSEDLQLCIDNSLIQAGTWQNNVFVVKQYTPAPDKIDLTNINVLTLNQLSGYQTTCGNKFPIYATTKFILNSDPVDLLEAATKQYVDRVIAEAISHAHDGDITIGGNLLVNGDAEIVGILTANNIVTHTLNGLIDSTGACKIYINCNLDVLGKIGINGAYGVSTIFTTNDGKTIEVTDGIITSVV